jgi:hypothetical protein
MSSRWRATRHGCGAVSATTGFSTDRPTGGCGSSASSTDEISNERSQRSDQTKPQPNARATKPKAARRTTEGNPSDDERPSDLQTGRSRRKRPTLDRLADTCHPLRSGRRRAFPGVPGYLWQPSWQTSEAAVTVFGQAVSGGSGRGEGAGGGQVEGMRRHTTEALHCGQGPRQVTRRGRALVSTTCPAGHFPRTRMPTAIVVIVSYPAYGPPHGWGSTSRTGRAMGTTFERVLWRASSGRPGRGLRPSWKARRSSRA